MDEQLGLVVKGARLEMSFIVSVHERARLLILNGGANIPIKTSNYLQWQTLLSSRGISSLAFDFRGIEGSGIDLFETSLVTRLEDARAALQIVQTDANTPVFVMGISAGAPIAIELSRTDSIAGLIIVSPAAYSQEAQTQNFGDAFSAAIRKPQSWRGSPDFTNLQSYKGRVLYAYGEQDAVIPNEILREYCNIVAENNGQVLRLASGHSFMREENPASTKARNIFTDAVVKYMLAK